MAEIPTVAIPRLSVSRADLLRSAAAVGLRDASTGAPPRLATRCAIFRDDDHLYCAFTAEDDGVVATHRDHDAPLYEEDVFEIFLAPTTLTDYFEIEINPLGATFDARVSSPDGHRGSMRVDRGWECDGLRGDVRCLDARTEATIAIPFRSLGVAAPGAGTIWRANLYRIDRSAAHGDEYCAWSPTFRSPADFHVPAAFGRFRFE